MELSGSCATKILNMDIGEAIHVLVSVKPECEQDIPFTIREAKWELMCLEDYQEKKESEGECRIIDHDMDAFIEPKRTGKYKLRFIYKIADETWVDVIEIKVG